MISSHLKRETCKVKSFPQFRYLSLYTAHEKNDLKLFRRLAEIALIHGRVVLGFWEVALDPAHRDPDGDVPPAFDFHSGIDRLPIAGRLGHAGQPKNIYVCVAEVVLDEVTSRWSTGCRRRPRSS